MSVQVKGSGTIGGLDEGLVVSGIVTSSTQINVGSNIKLGSAGVCTATSFVGSGANLTSLPAANLTGTLPAISGANLTSLPSQATIANNADNRVITGGSGVNLNGESNLTYNGATLTHNVTGGLAKLDVKGSVAGGALGASISVRNTNSANNGSGEFQFQDPGSNIFAKIVGINLTDGSNNGHMIFHTASATSGLVERLRIKDDGKVGIGMNDPAATLHIGGGADTNPQVRIQRTSGYNNAWKIYQSHYAASDYGTLFLQPTLATTPNVEITNAAGAMAMRVDSDTGVISVKSGGGIDFSATSDAGGMTSELLDDYEEGSFTPFFRGDASAGSYGYSRQIGRYTKIGQRVFFNLYLTLNAVSANASGNLMIYGLPYTSEGSNAYSFAGVAYYYGFNGITPQSGLIDISNTRLYLYQNNATSNIVNSTPAGALTTTSSIIMGGQYSVG